MVPEKEFYERLADGEQILIPYYQFTYTGEEYHSVLRRHRNMAFNDGTSINQHFLNLTLKQFGNPDSYTVFERATLYIVHYFTRSAAQEKGIDLDNLAYKGLIDAIKKFGIIRDDTWYNLGLTIIGRPTASEEKIDAYVVPHGYETAFQENVLIYDPDDLFDFFMSNKEWKMLDQEYGTKYCNDPFWEE